MSHEEVTARLQPVSEPRDDLGLRTLVEIDHHVSTKNDRVQGIHRKCFDEIDSLECDAITQLRFDTQDVG